MSEPKAIFITGAAGYLGQKTIARLRRSQPDWKLIGFDIKELKSQDSNVSYLQGDLRNAALAELFRKYRIEQVVHLAAVLDGAKLSREQQYQIDVEGTKRVLSACVEARVQRVILSSSGAAYGYHSDNPDWLEEDDTLRGNEIFPYSDHKRQVEELAVRYREKHPYLEQTILRFCTIIGKDTSNLITNLFEQRRMIGILGYDSAFVFIWDEDAARVLEQSILSPKTGIYNVAGDGALPLRNIAKLLNKAYIPLPLFLLYPILWLGSKLGLLGYGPEQLLFLQYRPVLNNKKLKADFGFIPEKNSLKAFAEYAKAKHKKNWKEDSSIPILYPQQD